MDENFWREKKVLVTGGVGFIGSHLVEKLFNLGANVTVLSRSPIEKTYINYLADKITFIRGDCTNTKDAESACFGQEIVMNLAAKVGGIEYNRTHQATMLRENLMIATTMLEAARRAGVKRFLVTSSACVYPRNASIPTPEEEGFKDEPEPTNGGYGWAKRMSERLGKYYAEEYGMKIAIVRPYNCYGPRDHFDPTRSHVIPALIKRVFEGENPLKVWGSGYQTRAFLYVEDLVNGMIQAIEKYPVPDPINLGTDEEVSIKDLVNKIVTISGIKTEVVFDTSKPDGSPRRQSDNKKAKEKIGFEAKIPLDEGLKRTIEWYKKYVKK
ncbi:MAG: GDP-L-fucose synthase [Patescibacteria group bacterium]|nr:MAG: GDP-L-fucose synthase [Patescibacteria group bacterium]